MVTFKNDDLPNHGRTTHYQIQYDTTLNNGQELASQFVQVVEDDFSTLAEWFGNIPLTIVSLPIVVNVTAGDDKVGAS